MRWEDCRIGDEVIACDGAPYGITTDGWRGYITGIRNDGYIYVWDYKDHEGGHNVDPQYFYPAREIEQSKPKMEPNEVITEAEREYLLDSMQQLLDEYDYQYSKDALDKIIDTWAVNKADLITAFRKHPNYKEGKFLIAFERSYERGMDIRAIKHFSRWFNDYIRDIYLNVPKVLDDRRKEGTCLEDDLFYFCYNLEDRAYQFLTKEDEELLNRVIPEIHPHAGQKMSRVVNKIFRFIGFDKISSYEREFAKYADALNPITVKQNVVLSINPLDYLTMSFGNSWSSCHTIDKENKRDMPNSYEGMYSSGTMSYLLDGTSMVLYALDSKYKGDDYWDEPKVNRQMFHYGQDKLIQSRLYPQSNDGDDKVYEPYRNIVQEIIATIFDFPNNWKRQKGVDPISDAVRSRGTHYRDYTNFNSCSICRPTSLAENVERMVIGHDPICIKCGNSHDRSGNISCCPKVYYCTVCGKEISGDEIRWIDGKPYCIDDVYYCEDCCEYHIGKPFAQVRGYNYCEEAINSIGFMCPTCGEWELKHYGKTHPETKEMICKSCFNEEFIVCYSCGKVEKRNGKTGGTFMCDACTECMTKQLKSSIKIERDSEFIYWKEINNKWFF